MRVANSGLLRHVQTPGLSPFPDLTQPEVAYPLYVQPVIDSRFVARMEVRTASRVSGAAVPAAQPLHCFVVAAVPGPVIAFPSYQLLCCHGKDRPCQPAIIDSKLFAVYG